MDGWWVSGQRVDSAANIFGRTCCYSGLHVYGKREYHSNIKEQHSYFHIRVLALGISFGLVDYDKAFMEKAVGVIFHGRQKVIEINLLALFQTH